MLLLLGMAAILDRLGFAELTPLSGLGLVVLSAGIGLVVGTWFGRARGLIAMGLIGTLSLAAINSVQQLDLNLGGGFGERQVDVDDVAELDDSYELFAGSLVIDLRDLELDQDRTVDAGLTFGELIVVVPDDLPVEVDASVAAGQLDVLGTVRDGTGLDMRVTGGGDQAGTLSLTGDVVFGELTVERESAGRPPIPDGDRGVLVPPPGAPEFDVQDQEEN